MNPLFDTVLKSGLLLDALGVIGLGLIGLSAVRLSQRRKSWGGTLMALGAIGLLVARLMVIVRPHLSEMGLLQLLGDTSARVTMVLPTFLLTLGLAGVVWGIWAHERWLRETARD